MKMIALVTLALVAVVVAAPLEPQPDLDEIVDQKYELIPGGGYTFGYKTKKGVEKLETGELKQVLNEKNEPQNVVVTRGSFTYIRDDGMLETIEYISDETGFHPVGKSIPVSV